jgi:uncharacterized membrane protein YphA (DoxX/SURF4 family)
MTMSAPNEPVREIPMWSVAVMAVGFLIATVSLLGGFPLIGAIGAIVVVLVAILTYKSQGSASGLGGLSAPALHRDLAKTHCGSCGAPMRSNMIFCPVCGAAQTPT